MGNFNFGETPFSPNHVTRKLNLRFKRLSSKIGTVAEMPVERKKRARTSDDLQREYAKNKKLVNENLENLRIGGGPSESFHPKNMENSGSMGDIDSDESIVSPNNSETEAVENQRPETGHDYMISVLKGGQRKYLRKVDYLIDETIRKSQRRISPGRNQRNINFGNDACIPGAVGPSPNIDSHLAKLWPVPVRRNPNISSDCNSEDFVPADDEAEEGPRTRGRSRRGQFFEGGGHAGVLTHTDWGIEEVTTGEAGRSGDENPSEPSDRSSGSMEEVGESDNGKMDVDLEFNPDLVEVDGGSCGNESDSDISDLTNSSDMEETVPRSRLYYGGTGKEPGDLDSMQVFFAGRTAAKKWFDGPKVAGSWEANAKLTEVAMETEGENEESEIQIEAF